MTPKNNKIPRNKFNLRGERLRHWSLEDIDERNQRKTQMNGKSSHTHKSEELILLKYPHSSKKYTETTWLKCFKVFALLEKW